MSNLAEQLQSVRLKKSSEPTKDYSSPKTAGFLQQGEIDSYQSSVLDVNTEEWLHLLVDYTFPSRYSPLTVDEAKVFVNIYERLYANCDPPTISKITWQDKLSAEESETISQVTTRLQQVIDSFVNNEDDHVFVKLSSRSPKDAPMAQLRFKSLYKKYLMMEDSDDRALENTQITCLLKAAFAAMKVSNAHEVLDACLRSERVYQDLLLALAVPDRFRENWIVRQFIDIDVDMEFRAFVFKRKLTAISQYNYLIFSQRLVDNRKFYLDTVADFFTNKIKPKLENFVADYIIDFAVCEGGAKIWVIELNPFLPTTDSALFSWEHERALLEGSEDDVVFRITEKPRPGAKTMLPIGMKDLINECASELKET